MEESVIWIFLYSVLHVFPFFSLRHVTMRDRLSIPFGKLMLYATIIMIVQGTTYVWLVEVYDVRVDTFAWHRKLFVIPYVILTLKFSTYGNLKTLFMEFFMVGIIMAVMGVSYIVEGTWFAQAIAIAPYQMDAVVRGGITLLIYPPLVLLFQKYLKPIMRLQSIGAWKYITAIPFTFAILSIVTTAQLCKQEMSVVNLVLSMSIIGGSFFVCICLSKAFRQMEAALMTQERSKQTNRLLALQKTQYNTLAKNIEQTRETMHDIRHQLAAISMMTQRKEYDKLLAFVADYCKSLPDNRMVLCENFAANSIIAHYVELAKGEGIVDIDIKCVLGYDSRIEDIDLCALLGNLLENAIEGCKTVPLEKRKIKLRMNTYAGGLMLTLDNSFDGMIERVDNAYISRKRDGKQKGVGQSSVENIIKKYNGEFRCEQKNGFFMVSARLLH